MIRFTNIYIYIYTHIIYTIYCIYIIYNNLKTIRYFIKNIFMTLSDGYKNQSDLLIEIIDSNKDQKTCGIKMKKGIFMKV